jgi:hypothetical protein
MSYFVCGGEYRKSGEHGKFGDFEFCLVSPTGRKSLPYVAEGERMGKRLADCSQHHAHLYRLADDLRTVILVLSSQRCWVHGDPDALYPRNPEMVTLTDEDVERVRKAIAEGCWKI